MRASVREVIFLEKEHGFILLVGFLYCQPTDDKI